jgi:hypothetical protein
MSSRPALRLDWATHASAKYACENWHYSKCMPAPLQGYVRIGGWEGDKFSGVLVYSHGNNRNIGSPWGLTVFETAELTRIALRRDHEWPVSRYIAISLRMLQKRCPGLRAVVSYADTGQGHCGGVYKASGWIYTGAVSGMPRYFFQGREWQQKAFSTSHPTVKFSDPRVTKIPPTVKHRYLWLFDKSLTSVVKSIPYPCAESRVAAAPGFQSGEDT